MGLATWFYVLVTEVLARFAELAGTNPTRGPRAARDVKKRPIHTMALENQNPKQTPNQLIEDEASAAA